MQFHAGVAISPDHAGLFAEAGCEAGVQSQGGKVAMNLDHEGQSPVNGEGETAMVDSGKMEVSKQVALPTLVGKDINIDSSRGDLDVADSRSCSRTGDFEAGSEAGVQSHAGTVDHEGPLAVNGEEGTALVDAGKMEVNKEVTVPALAGADSNLDTIRGDLDGVDGAACTRTGDVEAASDVGVPSQGGKVAMNLFHEGQSAVNGEGETARVDSGKMEVSKQVAVPTVEARSEAGVQSHSDAVAITPGHEGQPAVNGEEDIELVDAGKMEVSEQVAMPTLVGEDGNLDTSRVDIDGADSRSIRRTGDAQVASEAGVQSHGGDVVMNRYHKGQSGDNGEGETTMVDSGKMEVNEQVAVPTLVGGESNLNTSTGDITDSRSCTRTGDIEAGSEAGVQSHTGAVEGSPDHEGRVGMDEEEDTSLVYAGKMEVSKEVTVPGLVGADDNLATSRVDIDGVDSRSITKTGDVQIASGAWVQCQGGKVAINLNHGGQSVKDGEGEPAMVDSGKMGVIKQVTVPIFVGEDSNVDVSIGDINGTDSRSCTRMGDVEAGSEAGVQSHAGAVSTSPDHEGRVAVNQEEDTAMVDAGEMDVSEEVTVLTLVGTDSRVTSTGILHGVDGTACTRTTDDEAASEAGVQSHAGSVAMSPDHEGQSAVNGEEDTAVVDTGSMEVSEQVDAPTLVGAASNLDTSKEDTDLDSRVQAAEFRNEKADDSEVGLQSRESLKSEITAHYAEKSEGNQHQESDNVDDLDRRTATVAESCAGSLGDALMPVDDVQPAAHLEDMVGKAQTENLDAPAERIESKDNNLASDAPIAEPKLDVLEEESAISSGVEQTELSEALGGKVENMDNNLTALSEGNQIAGTSLIVAGTASVIAESDQLVSVVTREASKEEAENSKIQGQTGGVSAHEADAAALLVTREDASPAIREEPASLASLGDEEQAALILATEVGVDSGRDRETALENCDAKPCTKSLLKETNVQGVKNLVTLVEEDAPPAVGTSGENDEQHQGLLELVLNSPDVVKVYVRRRKRSSPTELAKLDADSHPTRLRRSAHQSTNAGLATSVDAGYLEVKSPVAAPKKVVKHYTRRPHRETELHNLAHVATMTEVDKQASTPVLPPSGDGGKSPFTLRARHQIVTPPKFGKEDKDQAVQSSSKKSPDVQGATRERRTGEKGFSRPVEQPDWLPEGWTLEIRVREGGSTAGTKDKYYHDPKSGHRFRSRNEVMQYLESGRFGRWQVKSDVLDPKTPSHTKKTSLAQSAPAKLSTNAKPHSLTTPKLSSTNQPAARMKTTPVIANPATPPGANGTDPITPPVTWAHVHGPNGPIWLPWGGSIFPGQEKQNEVDNHGTAAGASAGSEGAEGVQLPTTGSVAAGESSREQGEQDNRGKLIFRLKRKHPEPEAGKGRSKRPMYEVIHGEKASSSTSPSHQQEKIAVSGEGAGQEALSAPVSTQAQRETQQLLPVEEPLRTDAPERVPEPAIELPEAQSTTSASRDPTEKSPLKTAPIEPSEKESPEQQPPAKKARYETAPTPNWSAQQHPPQDFPEQPGPPQREPYTALGIPATASASGLQQMAPFGANHTHVFMHPVENTIPLSWQYPFSSQAPVPSAAPAPNLGPFPSAVPLSLSGTYSHVSAVPIAPAVSGTYSHMRAAPIPPPVSKTYSHVGAVPIPPPVSGTFSHAGAVPPPVSGTYSHVDSIPRPPPISGTYPPVGSVPIPVFEHFPGTSPSLHLGTTPSFHLGTTPSLHLGGASPSLHLSTAPSLHLGGGTPSLHLGTAPSLHLGSATPSLHLGTAPSLHLGAAPSLHLGPTPTLHLGTSPTLHLGTTPSFFPCSESSVGSRARDAAGISKPAEGASQAHKVAAPKALTKVENSKLLEGLGRRLCQIGMEQKPRNESPSPEDVSDTVELPNTYFESQILAPSLEGRIVPGPPQNFV